VMQYIQRCESEGLACETTLRQALDIRSNSRLYFWFSQSKWVATLEGVGTFVWVVILRWEILVGISTPA
jgi:hypothetical protein